MKTRDASLLGSFPKPTDEEGRESVLANQEGWAKWGQLGSFQVPAVARDERATTRFDACWKKIAGWRPDSATALPTVETSLCLKLNSGFGVFPFDRTWSRR